MTVDAVTGETLADDFPRQLRKSYNFYKPIAGAPRDIITRFFYDAEFDDGALTQEPEDATAEGPTAVDQPEQPTDVARAIHNLSHSHFEKWCEFYVAARGRGI